MKGKKTGGRARGTPNRRTTELVERLEDLGCDPVAGLVAIANDASTEPGLRARIYADLLPYVFPKRKAIEHAAAEGTTFVVRWASATPADADEALPE